MRLSSRKQLLKESDELLIEIKNKIRNKSIISEGVILDFFKNLVKSISASFATWLRTNRAYKLYVKMPYLLGVDLVNNNNLKIDQYKLRSLDKLINQIINDVRTSSKLKSAMEELERADLEWAKNRSIYAPQEMRDEIAAKNAYYSLLNNKIAEIVEDILKGPKYSSFQERVSQLLKSGLSGISDEEMQSVKRKYFDVLNKRAADYIDKWEVYHELTGKELADYSKLTSGDFESRTKPFGWKRAKIEKGEFTLF